MEPTINGKFYSGRGYSGIRSGQYPNTSYKYSRAQYFACVLENGDLEPHSYNSSTGQPVAMSYSESGIDWAHLETFLTEQIVTLKVFPIVGLWICNIDKPFTDPVTNITTPQMTQAGFTAFITRLSSFLTSIGGEILFVPAWEFNQPSSIGGGTANDWGLGVANSPRMWAIQPNAYNTQMTMMRSVIDAHSIKNILLVAAPEPRHVAYIYPDETATKSAWGGWDGVAGGRVYMYPFVAGMQQAHAIGCSWYIKDAFMEDRAVLNDILTVGWNWKIVEMIDPTKPFFLWEYNTINFSGGGTAATPLFVEYSYDIIANSTTPRYLLLSWWVPFTNTTTAARTTELAKLYNDYTPAGVDHFENFIATPNPVEANHTTVFTGELISETDSSIKTVEIQRQDSPTTWTTIGVTQTTVTADPTRQQFSLSTTIMLPSGINTIRALWGIVASPILELVVTSIPQGILHCTAKAGDSPVPAVVTITGISGTFTTEFSLPLNVGTYDLSGTYNGQTVTASATIVQGQTTDVLLTFTSSILAGFPWWLAVIPAGIGLAFLALRDGGKKK